MRFAFQLGQRSIQMTFQDLRMDITFSANCRSVAEQLRYGFDRQLDLRLCICFRLIWIKIPQGHERIDRARPGTEILRREILIRNIP